MMKMISIFFSSLNPCRSPSGRLAIDGIPCLRYWNYFSVSDNRDILQAVDTENVLQYKSSPVFTQVQYDPIAW